MKNRPKKSDFGEILIEKGCFLHVFEAQKHGFGAYLAVKKGYFELFWGFLNEF